MKLCFRPLHSVSLNVDCASPRSSATTFARKSSTSARHAGLIPSLRTSGPMGPMRCSGSVSNSVEVVRSFVASAAYSASLPLSTAAMRGSNAAMRRRMKCSSSLACSAVNEEKAL